MWKVAKYKILTLLEDKIFRIIVISFFLILNYEVFLKSGILSDGSKEFNEMLKYTLLINNYTITATIFGLLVGIYIGSGLIGDDISSGKIYIMLNSFPKRWKYLLGNLLGLIILVTAFILLILFNYFISTTVLGVSINISDLIQCFVHIFMNMLVIMLVTSVASIFLDGKKSMVIGLIEMSIFNIYTFQKIPLVDYGINLDMNIRRIMVCIAPITNVSAPSIYNDGSLSRYIVEPIIVGNMLLYQIMFILIIILIGVIGFKYKEL